MRASPAARLAAAPTLPRAGISAAPKATCTITPTVLHRTTLASPPVAYRNTLRPELLSNGMSATLTQIRAGAAGMNDGPYTSRRMGTANNALATATAVDPPSSIASNAHAIRSAAALSRPCS